LNDSEVDSETEIARSGRTCHFDSDESLCSLQNSMHSAFPKILGFLLPNTQEGVRLRRIFVIEVITLLDLLFLVKL
jgi:hypothetical protein